LDEHIWVTQVGLQIVLEVLLCGCEIAQPLQSAELLQFSLVIICDGKLKVNACVLGMVHIEDSLKEARYMWWSVPYFRGPNMFDRMDWFRRSSSRSFCNDLALIIVPVDF
jgi:hypothetical protein